MKINLWSILRIFAGICGIPAGIPTAVDAVNNRQKRTLADKIVNYFEPQGGVGGKTLALWGLSFKANTDDIRESAALETIRILTDAGMKIRAYDPEAGANAGRVLDDNPLVTIADDQYSALEGAEALAVMTDWNQFRNPDFSRIKTMLKAPIIFDGRNLYSATFLAGQGFAYFCIGRPSIH